MPTDEAAAVIKVQAIQRGKLARQESKYIPGQVSGRLNTSGTSTIKSLGASGKQGSSWKMVRKAAGIEFTNWDMALQVVPKGFQGELAREVKRRIADAKDDPYGAYGLAFLVFLVY